MTGWRRMALVAGCCFASVPGGLRAGGAPGAEGQGLFEELCSGCHGDDASGGNAVDIRGVPREELVRALRGIEAMPEFVLTEGEVEAVRAYLGTLLD